jgi:hypothetical protein
MGRLIRVGSMVRLTRRVATAFPRQWARVRSIKRPTGETWVEPALEWSRGWNLADLEPRLPRKKAKR